MIFTDTHTHLYSKEFGKERNNLIENALVLGVKNLCLPSIDSSYYPTMLEVEQCFPSNIHLMMGLHPCYVKPETFERELEFVKNQLNQRDFIAVGEIGIDLYWDKSTLEIQKHAFRTQIQWAKERNLAINIHCREAFDEVFDILEKEKDDKLFGIFHCFTGDYSQAERAINLGMKLGIGGVVTFKNGKIDQFIHKIDLKHIVLETDAPYLAPAPHRGKRNESKYIPLIAEKLSQLYQISIEEVAQITTENAKFVYKF